MNVGVGKEIKKEETRVGMTPRGVEESHNRGQMVPVERDAGKASFIEDAEFVRAGAEAVNKETPYERAGLIVKVNPNVA